MLAKQIIYLNNLEERLVKGFRIKKYFKGKVSKMFLESQGHQNEWE